MTVGIEKKLVDIITCNTFALHLSIDGLKMVLEFQEPLMASQEFATRLRSAMQTTLVRLTRSFDRRLLVYQLSEVQETLPQI